MRKKKNPWNPGDWDELDRFWAMVGCVGALWGWAFARLLSRLLKAIAVLLGWASE